MIYLVDTNILLRFADASHPVYLSIRTAMQKLRGEGHILKITPQNCIEFWNVATRPTKKNGFGLTPLNAEQLLQSIEQLFPILPDSPDVYQEWRRLVVKFNVSGVQRSRDLESRAALNDVQVHDARLVALMRVNRIFHILTFNFKDFTRYSSEQILAVSPETIINN